MKKDYVTFSMIRPIRADDPRHGTTAGYQRGCRCELCRAATAKRQREYMHRTGRNVPLEVRRAQEAAKRAETMQKHGTEMCYTYGCRCRLCRAASTEGRRKRRARNPGPSQGFAHRAAPGPIVWGNR